MFKMFYVVFMLSGGEVGSNPNQMTYEECHEFGKGVNAEAYQCLPVKVFDAIVKAKAKAIGGGA